MKGTFKRALGAIAAAALALTGFAAVTGTANAAEGDSSTIVVTGDVAGRTFTAYPLGTYANAVDGENDCASSVDLVQSDEWGSPTIAEAATGAMTSVPTEYKGNELAYVASNATAAQLRTFAAALADADVKPAGTSVTAGDTASSVTIDVPDEGWYLVVDSAGSPLLIGTKVTVDDAVKGCLAGTALGTAVAKPSTIPTPGKVVLDENGDVVVDEDGNPVQDISALVGSTVTFQVTSNVPNHTGYTSYDWKIVDTPTDGLVIDESSVKVAVDGVTDFSAYTAAVADGVLTVTFADVTALPIGAAITITYDATVTEDAIVTEDNQAGAVNSVIAKHDDVTSEAGKVTVKSYGFEFTKVDSAGTALDGAQFTVQNASGAYLTPTDDHAQTGDWTFADVEYKFSGADGVFSFQGLPAGTYTVAETDVPDGYMQSVKATFDVTIAADGAVSVKESGLLGLVSVGETGAVTVLNVTSVTQLPATGAAGIALFVALGLLIAGAGVATYMKSRNVRNAMRA